MSATSALPPSPPRAERDIAIAAFLRAHGINPANRHVLAGDASFRRYDRITQDETSRVLMDAPPPFEDIRPFLHMQALLSSMGLRVPAIHAADTENGLLLLEDLGDTTFSRVLSADGTQESALYAAATEALAHLYRQSQAHADTLKQAVAPYDMPVYLREIGLFSEWFVPFAYPDCPAEFALRWRETWEGVLHAADLRQSVLVHRDYHADNLLWLAQADGIARVGMLDFQDGLLGDPAYDLASLLEDARRDVAPTTVADAIARYTSTTGENAHDFARRYAVLAAQRNAKIIGIFVRLAKRDGKQHYLHYLPRVWRHFRHDLAHPCLTPIAQLLESFQISGESH